MFLDWARGLRPNPAGVAGAAVQTGPDLPRLPHHGGIEAPALVHAEDVAAGPVHGVIVPRRQQDGLLHPQAAAQLLSEW